MEDFGNGISVWVTDVFRVDTDAMLLADFARPRTREMVCDLGSGCGILPFYWCASVPRGEHPYYAVEIQPEAVELMEQTVRHNQLEDRVIPVCADWNALPTALPFGRFDRVSCNPPYFVEGKGATSENVARRTARHAAGNVFAEVAAAASRLLKTGGRLDICCRPERLCDLFCALREHTLEPKILQPIRSHAGDPPRLLLCEARREAAVGLQIRP